MSNSNILGSKTITHHYDPGIVYHSHSSNIPHLNNWIDDLIQLTENKSNSSNQKPTTEDLVEAFQRYDAIFKELLHQTR